jgi:citrate synthase
VTEKITKTTKLCGYDADNIMVRDKNLVNDLMGKLTFTELLLLHLSGRMPTPLQVTITDAVLVSIMEHGLVPSAIATRLTHLGAPESFQGAVAAGLLGVGDRFAGTASESARLIETISAAPDQEKREVAHRLINELCRRKQPVPGFGHPIHRGKDPRVERLLEIARAAGVAGQHLAALDLLEECLEQELGRKLPTNISAAIAAVLGEAGIPAAIMRGIILVARCGGLVGHLHEEITDPSGNIMWQAVEAAVPFEKP